jgi:hypothetical protein
VTLKYIYVWHINTVKFKFKKNNQKNKTITLNINRYFITLNKSNILMVIYEFKKFEKITINKWSFYFQCIQNNGPVCINVFLRNDFEGQVYVWRHKLLKLIILCINLMLKIINIYNTSSVSNTWCIMLYFQNILSNSKINDLGSLPTSDSTNVIQFCKAKTSDCCGYIIIGFE